MTAIRRSFHIAAIGLVGLLGCLGAASAQVPSSATGIQWSTYFGGSGAEDITSVAVGPGGEIVVVGDTDSWDFPVTANAYMPSDPNGQWKAYITILDSTGSTVLYSTFIGGSGDEEALDVDVDDLGVITVLGVTTSTDFPTTPGAFDTSYNGGPNDLFLVRLDRTLDPSQQLLYSTYLGGSQSELVSFFNWASSGGKPALWVDDAGVVTVVGETNSSNFPITPGAYQPSLASGAYDGFIVGINPQGSGAAGLLYATYFGGTRGDFLYDLHVSDAGIVTVTGATRSPNFPTTPGAYDETYNGLHDALLAQFQPVEGGGTILLYSTFLGGTNQENGLSVDEIAPSGRFVVSGFTYSSTFPTTPGAYDRILNFLGSEDCNDGFVSVIDPAGLGSQDLKYSTFLGGAFADPAWAQTNSAGEVFAGGGTGYGQMPLADPNFPVTLGAADTSYNTTQDTYVARLRPDGQGGADLVYSTLLGGSLLDWPVFGDSIVPLSDDEVIFCGGTTSLDFPATTYQTAFLGGPWDGFVMRLDLRAHACETGNVDASKALVSDVLLVNGSSWSASGRVASVLKTNPFTIQMLAPPSALPPGPGQAPFVLYAWNASPAGTEHGQPRWLGRTCLPTPLNVGVMPQPIKIANNIGKPALGVENWPGSPTVPAPCVLLDLPDGIGKTMTFYLQGLIVDPAAPNGNAAVTNGIQVISQ